MSKSSKSRMPKCQGNCVTAPVSIRSGLALNSQNGTSSYAKTRGVSFATSRACIELTEIAVDSGMRVLCFNDDVDTDKEGWRDRLREAAQHHAKANFYTRKRLKRKIDSLWEEKAAVTKLSPGYLRHANHARHGPRTGGRPLLRLN